LQTVSCAAAGTGVASAAKTAHAIWSPALNTKDLDFRTLAEKCIDLLQAVPAIDDARASPYANGVISPINDSLIRVLGGWAARRKSLGSERNCRQHHSGAEPQVLNLGFPAA
jgi:hypothetical protein